jgi:hypothetical protein
MPRQGGALGRLIYLYLYIGGQKERRLPLLAFQNSEFERYHHSIRTLIFSCSLLKLGSASNESISHARQRVHLSKLW